jgi:hypothetical protein
MAGGSVDALVRRQTERITRTTANALKALPESWVVLHDVRWPGRPFASIDHIAVGPSGVFVIGSKRWTGQVQVAGDGLRHDGRRREREVLSAREAAAAVSRRLPHLPTAWVTPVLCMVSRDVDGWVGPVAVCHKSSIVELLTSLPTVLSPEVVHSVENDLRLQLRASALIAPSRAPSTVPLWARARATIAPPVAGLAFVAALAVSPQIVADVTDELGNRLVHTFDSGSKPADGR